MYHKVANVRSANILVVAKRVMSKSCILVLITAFVVVEVSWLGANEIMLPYINKILYILLFPLFHLLVVPHRFGSFDVNKRCY